MQITRVVFAIGMSVAAASCAKRTDAIVPVEIPMAAYANMSCQTLARELIKERSVLASLSEQQDSAATGDAVGVFLVGVPVSSTFGGNKEGLVAVSKGKVTAIESAIGAKRCN